MLKSTSLEWTVGVPANTTLSYIDLLRLVHLQNQAEMDRVARVVIDAAGEPAGKPVFELKTDCLLFWAMHKLWADAKAAKDPDLADVVRDQRRAGIWLIDFWMF